MTTNRLDLFQFELSYRSSISSCHSANVVIVLFDDIWGSISGISLSGGSPVLMHGGVHRTNR